MKVEIGVEAEAVWKPMEGLEGNVLSLVEGEEREVVCEGREGYPAPSFLWDSHAPSISERRSEEERDGSDGVRKREGKEVAERSVDLDLFNGEEEEAIPLNTTTKVREKGLHILFIAIWAFLFFFSAFLWQAQRCERVMKGNSDSQNLTLSDVGCQMIFNTYTGDPGRLGNV